MPRARYRAVDIPPRYLARTPWIGPIKGGVCSACGELPVGASVDPLLGEVLVAALVPVKSSGKHFERAPRTGWLLPILGDRRGPFHVRARKEWWTDGIDGLLMILLYDRSVSMLDARDDESRYVDRSFPGSWQEQLLELGSAINAHEPAPIEDLPREMRGEVETRVTALLQAPAKDLEVALIERTPPSPPNEIIFAAASCQYPAGFLDKDIAERSYARMGGWVAEVGEKKGLRPSCLLLLGDQVYIDATAGLFDPTALYDRYDLPYERLLRMEPLRHILRRIPAYAMLDDHEIEDNWEPGSGSCKNLRDGRQWYWRYQRLAGPPAEGLSGLWYRFNLNGFPFFMADTRTERAGRKVDNLRDAAIMDDIQWGALIQWLDDNRANDLPMFIATPASFLPRHRKATHDGERCGGLRSDGWDGYPASFHGLLQHIASNSIRNVVFLSGDEHISFAATGVIHDEAGKEVTRILSIHSSALYAPFAFANSTRDALACDETLRSGRYTCKVSTHFADPGDGFAVLRARRDGLQWRIEYLFDREPGPAPAIWTRF